MICRYRGALAGVHRLVRSAAVRIGCLALGVIAIAWTPARAATLLDHTTTIAAWLAVPAAILASLLAGLLVLVAMLRNRTQTQMREMVRLAAEHSRAEQERNHLFSQTSDLLFIGDLEARPVQLNLAWYRSLGYLPGELIDGSITATMHPSDASLAIEAARDLADHGGDKRFEVRMRTKAGATRWFSWTLTILPGGDRLLGIGRDITESREAAEEAARKNHELFDALGAARAAMQEKSRFLAATGHEIRNPLHAILGMTELLLTTRLSPEQREYALTVRDSSESLVGLLNDLLEYSRMEARGITVHNAPFRVREMIRGVLHLMTPKAAEKGLRLECTVDAEVPESILGDAGRMRQIVMNLVGNAIRFTDRGVVRIDVKEGKRANEDTLRISVTDTGIGVAPSDLETIFEPFRQLPGAVRRGGSGLGLSISKQLVEAMDGEIGVHSRVGEGSNFWFEVPAPAPRPIEAGAGVERGRVLVVEDNLVNQTLTRRLLEKDGYRVDVAHNGVEAVAAAARAGYDLIFMDIQMPEMDGLEATAAIRRNQRDGSHQPIVALTASVITTDLQGCLKAGMDDYLSKPFTREALREKVDRWTRQGVAAAAGP